MYVQVLVDKPPPLKDALIISIASIHRLFARRVMLRHERVTCMYHGDVHRRIYT